MSRDLHKLESALRSIQNTLHYTYEINFKIFAHNDMKTAAILMQFVNLREKFEKLSAAFQSSHPDLSYRDAKGIRNYIAHHYNGVL
jgi:uncharacterized protein with HEPN domain